jgi:hypothetical protein
MSPAIRARIARWLCAASIIAWPTTQLTVFRGEQPGTLGLSWFAIVLTFADIAATTDVRDNTDG